MSTTVRVAFNEELPPLAWPPYCPKCGAKEHLVNTTSRLGRVSSIRPNLLGGMTMKSDILYLSFPMCEKHSKETSWANIILDKGPLAKLLKVILYLGALMAITFLIRPKVAFSEWGLFSLYPLVGVLGVAAIIWAKYTTAIRPVRFDPDMDVFELHFLEERYASKFKLLNREATSLELTEAPPWYMRSLIWKIVVIVLFLAFMAKLMNH